MILIIGLGNKGISYRNTYHNMGFMVSDKLADMLKLSFNHSMCKAKVALSKDKQIAIAKPETFMNLSGDSVRALMRKFNLSISDIVVVYDDIDIPKGKLRIRDSGSAGTHNGMRSIIGCIGTQDFLRVRIGIGRDDSMELSDYVLSRLSREDRELLLPTVDKAAQALYKYIKDRDLEAMRRENN